MSAVQFNTGSGVYYVDETTAPPKFEVSSIQKCYRISRPMIIALGLASLPVVSGGTLGYFVCLGGCLALGGFFPACHSACLKVHCFIPIPGDIPLPIPPVL